MRVHTASLYPISTREKKAKKREKKIERNWREKLEKRYI
jgi:hypothetical protein